MAAHQVELTRATVNVRTVGDPDAPWTVVLAPDPPNVLEHYDELVELLEPHVRVVAYELPGFGQSRLARGEKLTLDLQVDVLVELLEHLGAAPAVLALPCVGGYVALELAHRRPELVEALVLVQTPSYDEGRAWADRIDPGGLLKVPVLGPLVVRLGKRWVARSWYRTAVGRDTDPGPFEATAEAAFDDGAAFPLAEALDAVFRKGPDGVPNVLRPSLVVWGDDDRTHRATDRDSSDGLAATEARADLPGAGHFPELEAPAGFVEALLAFLEGLDDRGTAHEATAHEGTNDKRTDDAHPSGPGPGRG